MDSVFLIPAIDSYTISLLEEKGNFNDYCHHLEVENLRVYNRVKDYLNGKNDDVENICEEVIEVFCYEEFASFDDEDEDGNEGERSPEFKSTVKKLSAKLNELRLLVSGKRSSTKQGDANMGTGKLVGRVIDTVVDDSKEIAIRMGAQQLAKTVREPLAAMMIASLQLEDNESVRAKVAGFLNSEIGLGLVSLACSMGVKALPLPGAAQDVLEGLSRELRLQSEMAIATPVVELVAAPMRLLLADQVLALPIPGLKPAAQLPEITVASVSVPEVKQVQVEVKKTAAKKSSTKKAKKTSTKKSVKKIANPEIVVKEIHTTN